MRGTSERHDAIYHTFNVEGLIEAGHPLRPIKRMVELALSGMSRTFSAADGDRGRPGIPPETLLKAPLPPLGDGADDGTWARWFVRSGQRRAAFKKSRRRRKLVEEFFGRVKTVAGLRRARHMGRTKITQCLKLAAAA
ncbi:MAG: hypothetical protein K2Q09_06940 [Phycisphaerales bacterium]|nr:hypothetical protein [Phycisphaerales bacterium]